MRSDRLAQKEGTEARKSSTQASAPAECGCMALREVAIKSQPAVEGGSWGPEGPTKILGRGRGLAAVRMCLEAPSTGLQE